MGDNKPNLNPNYRYISEEEWLRRVSEAKYQIIIENTDKSVRTRIYDLITNERARQDYLHPEPMAEKSLAILGEEFGEVCRADYEDKPEEYKTELIELAACCVRRLEEIL